MRCKRHRWKAVRLIVYFYKKVDNKRAYFKRYASGAVKPATKEAYDSYKKKQNKSGGEGDGRKRSNKNIMKSKSKNKTNK